MKNIHLIVILFGSTFYLLSCNKGEKSHLTEDCITYQLEKLLFESEEIALTDFASKVEQIPLEIKDNILVVEIKKVLDVDSLLLVVHGSRCSVFDRNGRYKYDISQKGNGPHEYKSLSDVFIDKGRVVIHDKSFHKLRFYTLQGDPVQEIYLSENFQKIFPIHNNQYAGYIPNKTGKEPIQFIFFNNKEIVDTIPYGAPKNYENNNAMKMFWEFPNDGNIFYAEKEYYFKELFNDTIYTFSPDKQMTPRMILDFENYKVEERMRFNYSDLSKPFFDGFAHIYILGENKNHLFFSAFYSQNYHPFFIDKKTQTAHHAKFIYSSENTKNMVFTPRCISDDNNRLISWTYPADEDYDDQNPTLIIATVVDQ